MIIVIISTGIAFLPAFTDCFGAFPSSVSTSLIISSPGYMCLAKFLNSSIKLIIFLRKNSFNKRKDKNESEKSFILKANPVHQKAIKIVLSIVFMFIIQWLPLWTGNLFFKIY